eukprot:gene667-6692_t
MVPRDLLHPRWGRARAREPCCTLDKLRQRWDEAARARV